MRGTVLSVGAGGVLAAALAKEQRQQIISGHDVLADDFQARARAAWWHPTLTVGFQG
jgi:hypothetical protein